jgi:hypothetical protein
LQLPLPLKSPVAFRGQAIFNDPATGKCGVCHFNAGANADTSFFKGGGNLNFNTGVEDLPDQPAHLTAELDPRDDGFGFPGDGTFNVPPLVEAADTGPFFHNNSVTSIEGAVAFYDGEAFNKSPAATTLANLTGSQIELDATQIVAIAAFLRVINALENIRQSRQLLASRLSREYPGNGESGKPVRQAGEEITDAINDLSSGGLHPKAVYHLEKALKLVVKNRDGEGTSVVEALSELNLAQEDMVGTINIK